MSISFNFDRMASLLSCFSELSSVRYSLADTENNLLCVSSKRSEFCRIMNTIPEGHARCKRCDLNALSVCASLRKQKYYSYRCHAGLKEVILPVHGEGEIVAYIFFGQMLDPNDIDQQWKNTREFIAWLPEADALKESFYKLERIDEKRINACAEILYACSSYLWLDGVVKSGALTELQRLNAYIDQNYSTPMKLDDMAKALSMSKTKVCSLAARQHTTVCKLITEKRVEKAKSLLLHTDHSISEISLMVGIPDYNYFTKLFKSANGMTPREYRKLFAKVRPSEHDL